MRATVDALPFISRAELTLSLFCLRQRCRLFLSMLIARWIASTTSPRSYQIFEQMLEMLIFSFAIKRFSLIILLELHLKLMSRLHHLFFMYRIISKALSSGDAVLIAKPVNKVCSLIGRHTRVPVQGTLTG